jgi:hypothetical protein
MMKFPKLRVAAFDSNQNLIPSNNESKSMQEAAVPETASSCVSVRRLYATASVLLRSGTTFGAASAASRKTPAARRLHRHIAPLQLPEDVIKCDRVRTTSQTPRPTEGVLDGDVSSVREVSLVPKSPAYGNSDSCHGVVGGRRK